MPAQTAHQTPIAATQPQMRVDAASQPVAASPVATAAADNLEEPAPATADVDEAVITEQASSASPMESSAETLAAETPEAANMPPMEKTEIQPEEQLDIEAAVNSAVASDHQMGQETPELKDVSQAQEQPKAEASSQAPSHEQATIIRRPLFVPEAPRDVGLDDELSRTEPMPEEGQRTSLINRISGLWASKTDSANPSTDAAPTKEEPQLSRSNLTLPTVDEPEIMDLPKADLVQTSLPVDPVTKEENSEDDDLDIPAFLRRQAN